MAESSESEGLVEGLKGKAKEAAGALSDDDELREEGRAQQDKSDAERDAAEAEAEADAARADAESAERDQRRTER